MSRKIRIEEYVPAATFMMASFSRDRAELASRFSEFTTAYRDAFQTQLEQIKALEQTLKLSEKQKQITHELYLQTDALNKELNFLTFHFKRADLDPAVITAVKKDLRERNVEGACLKLVGLIQYVTEQQALLESKGMAAGFATTLENEKIQLEAKNAEQNVFMNNIAHLHAENRAQYTALYGYVSMIAEAGKIMYDGDVRESEYTIEHVLGRMRAGAMPKEV